MFEPRDKLVTASGVDLYYQRPTVGSGFVRFRLGKIYYLPRRIILQPRARTGVTTLQYGPHRVGDSIERASRLFMDEASFRASLRAVYRKAYGNSKVHLRAPTKDREFCLDDYSELLDGFSSGKEMFDWVSGYGSLEDFFPDEVRDELLRLGGEVV